MAELPSPSESNTLGLPECVAGVRVAISHTFPMDQYDFLVKTAAAEKSNLGDLLSEILTDGVHDFIQNTSNERADRVRIRARLRRTAAKKEGPAPKEAMRPVVPTPVAAPTEPPPPTHPNVTAIFEDLLAKGFAPDVVVLEASSRAEVPLPIVKVLYGKYLATRPVPPALVAEEPAAKPAAKASMKKPQPAKKAAPKKVPAKPKKAPQKTAKPAAKKPAAKKAASAPAKKKHSATRPVKRAARPKLNG